MTEIYQLGIKGLITNSEGQVLLLKVNVKKLKHNAHGAYWDLPGGRVEEGDSIEDTLARELDEELGCEIKGTAKEFAFSVANIRIPWGDIKSGLILAIFTCQLKDDSKIVISDEHVEYRWFDPMEAAEKLSVKYSGDFVDKVKSLA